MRTITLTIEDLTLLIELLNNARTKDPNKMHQIIDLAEALSQHLED